MQTFSGKNVKLSHRREERRARTSSCSVYVAVEVFSCSFSGMFLQTAPDYQLIQQFAQVAKLPFFEISITSGQLLGVFDTTWCVDHMCS